MDSVVFSKTSTGRSWPSSSTLKSSRDRSGRKWPILVRSRNVGCCWAQGVAAIQTDATRAQASTKRRGSWQREGVPGLLDTVDSPIISPSRVGSGTSAFAKATADHRSLRRRWSSPDPLLAHSLGASSPRSVREAHSLALVRCCPLAVVPARLTASAVASIRSTVDPPKLRAKRAPSEGGPFARRTRYRSCAHRTSSAQLGQTTSRGRRRACLPASGRSVRGPRCPSGARRRLSGRTS